MAMKRHQILLLLLVILMGTSVWRQVSVEREKRKIDAAYQEAQSTIQELSSERAQLNQELTTTRQTVEDQAGNISNMQQELKTVQDRLDKTLAEIASLQQEHQQLRQANSSLTTQLSSVMQEKQQLEAMHSDLRELRLAIRDVKDKMWQQRWAAWRARVDAQKRADQEQLANGNRGFVVRAGASTLGASPRLHVHVLEPNSQ